MLYEIIKINKSLCKKVIGAFLMASTRLNLIGCGSLGSALIKRLIDSDVFSSIVITCPRRESALQLLGESVSWSSSDDPYIDSDIYIIAVKPNQLSLVLPRLNSCINDRSIILSVAAAKNLSFYEGFMGRSSQVVRLMPNTPSRIGKGIVLAYSHNKSLCENSMLQSIFDSWGQAVWTKDEAQLDQLATVTACGPAFVFSLIESFTQAGLSILSQEYEYEKMLSHIIQLFLGSSEYIASNNKNPQALINEVTSPGGTTIAGLNKMNQNQGILNIMTSTFMESLKRTHEMQNAT
jgi:pyrroline-5-carboxylate reductase